MRKISQLSYLAGRGLFLAGTLLVIAFPGILALQGYHWLRHRTWPKIPTAAVFHYYGIPLPHSQWHSIQIVLDGIMGCPFGACLLVAGTIIMCWGEGLMKKDERDW